MNSQQLTDARKYFGFTISYVANEVGLSRIYLSNFEKGRHIFPPVEINRLIDFYENIL